MCWHPTAFTLKVDRMLHCVQAMSARLTLFCIAIGLGAVSDCSASTQQRGWIPGSTQTRPGSTSLIAYGNPEGSASGWLQEPGELLLPPDQAGSGAKSAQEPGKTGGEDPDGTGEKPAAGQEKEEGADEKQEADEEKSLEDRIKELEKESEKAAEDKKKKAEEDALKPSVKPRGRLHTDANWFSQNDANRATVGDLQDGVFFRRARLGFDAKAFEITEYRLDFEMGSGGNRPSIFDAYGRLTQLPRIGNLQLGHFREPFSLEAQTSSNWFTFIERGFNNTFDPSRNWGLMAFNHTPSENLVWAVGVFREGADNFGDDIGDSGERAVTGRLAWLPYYDEACEGRHFLELGTSFSFRDPDNRFLAGPGGPEESIVRYQGRPANLNEDGIGTVPSFVSVSVPDATDVQLIGLEASWNIGAINIQSEYIGSNVDRFGAPSAWFHGTYLQASYFLTGESRQYDRKTGTFTRAKVNRPFIPACVAEDGCRGPGAWEVAFRWNYLDLSDAGINGGYIDGTTFGLNWYLNPYTRLMFNWGLNDLHDPADGRSAAQWLGTRLDVHF
jgi:phosphate-selective porin OprO and OprP